MTTGTGVVIVDNIGSFSTTSGILSIVAFKPTGFLDAGTEIKISVLPANQSAIVPERNNIIIYDADASNIVAVSSEADY